jgi:hypothetical protein
MINIVEPIFVSVIRELESILAKMHKEDYQTSSRNSTSTSADPQSFYTTEYLSKLRWVFRELFSKLLCKQTTVDWYFNNNQGQSHFVKE